MRAGKLDRRVSIETNTPVQDVSGEEIADWARIGPIRWASIQAVSGEERFIAEQLVARQQNEFHVRWSSDLSSLHPGDRVVYPVTSTPVDSEIYDILAVHEIGRREGLRIITARRAET
jgi:head-tail adaptor